VDPPEERLYPVLDDCSTTGWRTSIRPLRSASGLKWSPQTTRSKISRRNQIPYQWLDVEIDAGARKLDEQAGNGKIFRWCFFQTVRA
jgi:hypothetical protein